MTRWGFSARKGTALKQSPRRYRSDIQVRERGVALYSYDQELDAQLLLGGGGAQENTGGDLP